MDLGTTAPGLWPQLLETSYETLDSAASVKQSLTWQAGITEAPQIYFSKVAEGKALESYWKSYWKYVMQTAKTAVLIQIQKPTKEEKWEQQPHCKLTTNDNY